MRGPRRTLPATLLIGVALALLAVAPAAAANDRHEVPWTVDAALRAQAENPGAPPPGANDFTCKPSARHPDPVVLVHGLAATMTVNWQTMSPFLANRGYCVFALTYGQKPDLDLGVYQPGGLVRMQRSARQLGRFVDRVLRRTGAREVDIVGHSEGSLMPDWYVRFQGGARKVDDYVGLTTLWDGTNTAGLATINQLGVAFGAGRPIFPLIDQSCGSCRQFLQGSRFLRRLHARGVVDRRVDYTSIVTRNDELVVPWTSGLLPKRSNTRNVVLQRQCPLDQAEHASVMADPVVAGNILRALDPRRAPKPPCVPVLPLIGAPGYRG